MVSIEFARKYQLQKAEFTAPTLEAVGNKRIPTYGVWTVLIALRDSRGTEKIMKRSCVAVDRDPRLDGSPVLLSNTTLTDYRIVLVPWRNCWWFESESSKMEILTAYQFGKSCRKRACVYAILQLPEDDPALPGEDEYDSVTSRDRVPPELAEYEDVFQVQNSQIMPPRKETDHKIELQEGATPPYGPIYPLSQTELKTLREYLDENLKNGRIRPSTSPAGAPILFVPKKDGGLRLCVDYRGLNKVSVKNRYPLPLISEILDRLSGAKFFSKVDIQDAYYRIRINEGEEWKTAFRTRYGHYEYMVMPFGLTNAPATFQSYIHTALAGLLDTICIAYLDDVLIFSRTRKEHTIHLRKVLERLREAQLFAKSAKCVFYQPEVEFLGFIVGRQGIAMDQQRVEAISRWELPRTYHDIQVFLGFCNFYRRFIQDYSLITLPLTELLKGSKNGKKPGSVQLNERETKAFRTLLEAFTKAPLLRFFDPARPIRVETDASGFGMAGILSQLYKEVWHPVAFWSKKFTPAERNYATSDQELYAIVWSFKHWRQYLEGSRYRVEVLSDHNNLKLFMQQPKINGRQARWCLYLTPFDFVILHRSGKTNPADGLSRTPGVEKPPPVEEMLGSLRDRFGSEAMITVQELLAVDRPFEEERREDTSHSARTEALACGESQSVDVRSTSSSLDDPAHESIVRIGCVFHTNRTRSMDDGDDAIGHMDHSRTDSGGSRTGNGIDTESTRTSRESDISQSTGLNSVPTDPYGVVAVEGPDQGNNMITYEELSRAQFVPPRIVLAATAVEDASCEGTSEELEDLVVRLQLEDATIRERKAALSKGEYKGKHWSVNPKGLLCYADRLYIPVAGNLRSRLIQICHDDPLAGHFGRARTIELLQRKYHWEGLQNEVRDYIASCAICQGVKAPRRRPYGQLQSLPVPQRPFAELTMDFITGLPEVDYQEKTVDAILVIVDRLTKYSRFIPVSTTINAAELAELFHDQIELEYGNPDGIVSDRGSVFTSEFWSELCYHSKIKLRYSTAFHPQTDGQTERMNQVLEDYLRCFVDEQRTNWARLLKTAQFACNNAVNQTIQETPFRALMDINPNFQLREDSEKAEMPSVESRLSRLRVVREKAQKAMREAQERHQKYYNKRHIPREFQKSELVKLSTKNLRFKGQARKLLPRWIGPFRIRERIGLQAYRLWLPDKYERLHDVFPVSLLDKWNARREADEPLSLPDLDEDEEWEIEEIRDEKQIQGEPYFYIKWKGWPSEYNTWEPEIHMGNARDAIRAYRKQKNKRRTTT